MTDVRSWTQALQEATASERLSLDEEFSNQASWRLSHDKLTFIICRPLSQAEGVAAICGDADADSRMVGDINLFLHPYHDGKDEAPPQGGCGGRDGGAPNLCIGEVDVMIADPRDRGRGTGKAAVRAFLAYVLTNLPGIIDEYQTQGMAALSGKLPLRLRQLMVRIKEGNVASIRLFRSLGFEQEGEVSHFGELTLLLGHLDAFTESMPEGYAELVYARQPR